MEHSVSDKNGLPYKYDALCKTDIIESEKYTFVWQISKLSSRTETNGEELDSDEFSIKGPDDKITKWRAQIYPRGHTMKDSNYISFFLEKQTVEKELDACFSLFYLDANGVKQTLRQQGVVRFDAVNGAWGWDQVINRKELARYTQGDILTLLLEITIMGETKKSIEIGSNEERYLALTENYHQKQLLHDVKTLFLSKDHSDVIIRCGEKLYDCHKIILTSRSPVFKTMLEAEMKEKMTGKVEIKNMDPEVLEDLLKYIYSGLAPNIDEHPHELFAAADQYQLDKLKELCELKLCSRLDDTNCIDLLILSDLHKAQTLKTAALTFVSKNIHKIDTTKWKQRFVSHPVLLTEVVEMMLPKNDDNIAASDTDVPKRAAS